MRANRQIIMSKYKASTKPLRHAITFLRCIETDPQNAKLYLELAKSICASHTLDLAAIVALQRLEYDHRYLNEAIVALQGLEYDIGTAIQRICDAEHSENCAHPADDSCPQ
jgi:hypothetical protein